MKFNLILTYSMVNFFQVYVCKDKLELYINQTRKFLAAHDRDFSFTLMIFPAIII